MASGQTRYHALLPITEELTASSLTVTVDDYNYVLTSNGDGTYAQGNLPGAANPVGIYRENDAYYMALFGFDSGNHRVVIQEDTSSIETTECFKKAVRSVSSMMLKLVYDADTDSDTIEGATWSEAHAALDSGAMLFLNSVGVIVPCTQYDMRSIIFSGTAVDSKINQVSTWEYTWASNGSVEHNESFYPSPG